MAVNEITGIDPEVDRFVVFPAGASQSSHQHAEWPRQDGGPVSGGLGGQKWYKRVEIPKPVSDHRYTLTTEHGPVDADPVSPEGHPTGEWKPVHTLTRRSSEDLKNQIETHFQTVVLETIPATAIPAEMAAQIGAIARKLDGAVLTEAQESKKNKAKSTETILAALEARRDELFAAVDADEDYDIEAGWDIE